MAIHVKCQSCQKVIQVADSAAGKKARCPGCQSLVDIPVTKAPTTAPPRPATATPQESQKAASGASSSLKVACPSCAKVLQAPSSAVGKAIRCPGCQAVVKVSGSASTASPSATGATAARATSAAPASSSSGNAFWDALEDAKKNEAAKFSSISPVTNPYASPSLHHGGLAPAGPPLSNRTPYYVINGILIGLWGLLMSLGGLIQIGMTIYLLANLPQNVTIDYVKLTSGIVGAILGAIIGVVLVLGGTQMMFRSNLSIARNAAILAAIPCFGGCVFPFGIWAAILLYARRAERDFGHE